MTPQGPLGPFCQSCGMPMEKPEDFGTASSGSRINDYCHYCYREGAFTDPGVTVRQDASVAGPQEFKPGDEQC